MAVVEHNHTNIPKGKRLGQAALSTATTSLSGSLPPRVLSTLEWFPVGIEMAAYAFFPMIHTDLNRGEITGHPTDAADPDAARFALTNTTTATVTYDVDYRNIIT